MVLYNTVFLGIPWYPYRRILGRVGVYIGRMELFFIRLGAALVLAGLSVAVIELVLAVLKVRR